MKRFAFTLQSVLNVKSSLEKQQMAELGLCEQRLQTFIKELKDTHFRHKHLKANYNVMCKSGVTKQDMIAYNIGFKAIQEKINTQNEKIQMAEDEKARIQNKLLEIVGEKKMLEKLKDQQKEEYRLACLAEDANIIDDYLSSKR